MNIKLFTPYGFCFGVNKSIEIALKARNENPGSNIFVYGMLVHNENVSKMLEDNRIYSINDLYNLSNNDILVLNAHGSNNDVYSFLNEHKIKFYDATCNMVSSINKIISENINKDIIYVGIKNHSESNTSLSLSKKIYLYDINDFDNFDYSKIHDSEPILLRQSTISDLEFEKCLTNIKKHFNAIKVINTLCPYVKERQKFAENIENGLLIVVGSKKSNNANSLLNLSRKCKAILVNSINDIKKVDVSNYDNINIVSSTSAPASLVEEIFNYLKSK